MTDFVLNERLAADTMRVCKLKLCDVRLMNDRRWPWVMLVPMRAGVSEWHDLAAGDLISLSSEIALVSQAMREITNCEKVNVAALGNVVRQMHVHVVARNEGDPNWPAPIWGHGEAEGYRDSEAESFIERLAALID